EVLRERCPGIDWETPEVSDGPLRKYLILHTSVPAPPDEATGQPMALEVYGRLVASDEIDPNSPEGRRVIEEPWAPRGAGPSHEERYPPLEGELALVLETATYANVRYPGVRVPFYS